jgi:hypothetical protein
VPASICRSREVRFGRQATCGAPQRPGRRTGIQRDVPGPVAEPDRRPEPRGGGAAPALRRALVGGAGTRLRSGDQRAATRAGPRRRRSRRVDRARGRAGAGAIRASGHLKPASAAGPGCATRAVWRLTGATPTRASVGTSLCTRCSRELQATRPARTSGRRSSVQGTVRDGPATASSSKLHSAALHSTARARTASAAQSAATRAGRRRLSRPPGVRTRVRPRLSGRPAEAESPASAVLNRATGSSPFPRPWPPDTARAVELVAPAGQPAHHRDPADHVGHVAQRRPHPLTRPPTAEPAAAASSTQRQRSRPVDHQRHDPRPQPRRLWLLPRHLAHSWLRLDTRLRDRFELEAHHPPGREHRRRGRGGEAEGPTRVAGETQTETAREQNPGRGGARAPGKEAPP